MAINRRQYIFNSIITKAPEDVCTSLLGGTRLATDGLTKSSALALAIATTGTASAHQLKYLGIFNDSNDPMHLISQKVSCIVKAKSVKYCDNLATAYTISPQLKKYVESRVPKEDVEFQSPITTGDSLAHSLASNDIKFFLAGYPSFPILEDYTREYDIVVKKDTKDKKKGEIPLRADASYLYRLASPDFSKISGRAFPIRHFVEADSGKQRAGVIVDKIGKYIDYAGFNSVISCALNAIDFSVFLPDRDYMSLSASSSSNNYTNSSSYIHLNYLMQHNRLSTFDEAIRLLKESEEDLPKYNNNELMPIGIIKKHYKTLCKYIETLLKDNIHTFEDAKRENSLAIKGVAEKVKEYLDEHYISRRTLIFNALSKELPSLTTALMQGLDFCALPNHDLYSVYPFCYPRACNLDDAILKSLSFFGASQLDEYAYYSTLSNNTVLKNGYKCDDKTFFVENVDANLGGRIRVKQFFKYKENLSSVNTKVLCIVKDETAAHEFAKECAKEGVIVSYADYCKYKGINAPIQAYKALKGDVSIPVFIKYDDLWKLHIEGGSKGIFIIESKDKAKYVY